LIFVNRDEELKILQKLYAEDAFQFVAVYGRRRIGKTRLIQEFIRNRPAIYFLADSLSESEQLKNLGREIGEYFQDKILKERGFADWYQFFQYLQERAGSRLILVVDEFPYLVNANGHIFHFPEGDRPVSERDQTFSDPDGLQHRDDGKRSSLLQGSALRQEDGVPGSERNVF
jgi:AAA+ ATPase superfamily predicted ATPase